MSVKDEMMKEVEGIIEKLLEEQGEGHRVTLSEIEQAVWEAGQKIQGSLTTHLVKEHEKDVERPVKCPGCGGKLKNKGKKSKAIVTKTGEVRISREYYYCETCQEGFFPPG